MASFVSAGNICRNEGKGGGGEVVQVRLGGKKLLVRFFGARYHYLARREGGVFSCWILLLIEGVATGKGRGEGVACLCTI